MGSLFLHHHMVLFRNARRSSSRLVRDGMHDGGAGCSTPPAPPLLCDSGCLLLGEDPLQQAHPGDATQYHHYACAYESG